MFLQDEELQLLLNDMIDRYGYDFTGYSEASLKRRIEHFMINDHITDISKLRSLIVQNPDYFRHLVEEITVNVTEMLRDPIFYKTIQGRSIAGTRHLSLHSDLACRMFHR